mgnify:CR=1 FL=1
MDDQSLWKKEVSFERKPEEQTDADEPPVDGREADVPLEEGALVQTQGCG